MDPFEADQIRATVTTSRSNSLAVGMPFRTSTQFFFRFLRALINDIVILLGGDPPLARLDEREQVPHLRDLRHLAHGTLDRL